MKNNFCITLQLFSLPTPRAKFKAKLVWINPFMIVQFQTLTSRKGSTSQTRIPKWANTHMVGTGAELQIIFKDLKICYMPTQTYPFVHHIGSVIFLEKILTWQWTEAVVLFRCLWVVSFSTTPEKFGLILFDTKRRKTVQYFNENQRWRQSPN